MSGQPHFLFSSEIFLTSYHDGTPYFPNLVNFAFANGWDYTWGSWPVTVIASVFTWRSPNESQPNFTGVSQIWKCTSKIEVHSPWNVGPQSCLYFPLVFTALRGMQTRSSDENSVCLSVRLSNACIVTKRKKNQYSSIITNRKSTTRFPMSPRWTSYIVPISLQRVAQKRKVSKIWTINCDNSATVRDRLSVTINH